MDTPKIFKAIEILKRARAEVLPLLESDPDLQHHLSITYTRMLNGLCVVVGRPTEGTFEFGSQPERREVKPLTHIAGIPIGKAEGFMRSITEAEPNENEQSDFELDVNSALKEIVFVQPEEFLQRYSENVIRGVALKVGIDVREEDVKVNKAFVLNILGEIEGQSSLDKQLTDIRSNAVAGEEEEKPKEQATEFDLEELKKQSASSVETEATEGPALDKNPKPKGKK